MWGGDQGGAQGGSSAQGYPPAFYAGYASGGSGYSGAGDDLAGRLPDVGSLGPGLDPKTYYEEVAPVMWQPVYRDDFLDLYRRYVYCKCVYRRWEYCYAD